MGPTFRRRGRELVSRVAIQAIEASGAIWDPGSGTIVRVTPATLSAAPVGWFRRLCVRLESGGAVSPGWLPLARYPETLWHTRQPLVVFWFDGLDAVELEPLLDVLEELGWASLWSSPAGRPDRAAPSVFGGAVVPVGGDAGGHWTTGQGSPGVFRLVRSPGHASPGADGRVHTVFATADPLQRVPGWVFGDPVVVARGIAADVVQRVRGIA